MNNYFNIIKDIVNKIDKKVSRISFTVSNNNQTKKELQVNSLPVFSKLNIKYNLANFFICPENEIAFKIFQSLLTRAETNNNIFFLHADVGMGKTHLLQAVAKMFAEKSKLKSGYLSAEKFMYNFVHSVKANKLFELRDQNTDVDIYLIDDFHFICGKESTQKEFSYIINSLIELGKTVVIASTIQPYTLELNDQRTKSLLISSNLLHIKKFDLDSRLEVLRFFNKKNEIKFDDNILHIIASKVTSNVRELEAVVNNLTTYLLVSGKEPTIDNIILYIQHHVRSSIQKITFDDVLNAVMKFYRVSKNDITSKKRTKTVVLARVVLSYLAKELTTITLQSIGAKLGDRNHATILYYIQRFSDLYEKNKEFAQDLETIKNSINR